MSMPATPDSTDDIVTSANNGASSLVERQAAVAELADDGDWLVFATKSLIPQIKHLFAIRTRKAVEQAERPLRARIKELETELQRLREAIARAVEPGE